MRILVQTTKHIKKAKYAGFCYGVKRAIDLSIKTKLENPDEPVYILGQLIHNNQAINKLKEYGIQTLNDIPENLDGFCIIRTHGITPQQLDILKQKKCTIIDATCPDVKRVQDKAKWLAQQDYQVIIIGRADHPEVLAIKAHADIVAQKETIVVSSIEDVKIYLDIIKKSKDIGIVIQTTQQVEKFKQILPLIAEYSKHLRVFNTICSATTKRQKHAYELANNSDLMIVVGSKTSANTTHLAELTQKITKTIHVETEKDLDNYKDIIEMSFSTGITAGASTPEFIIEEVVKKIGELSP